MATDANATTTDALKKVFTQIAAMKLLPDAGQHAQFIAGMEGAIVKYLQTITTATIGGGAGIGGPGGGIGAMPSTGGPLGAMGGGMSGPPPGPQQIAPGGGMGGMSGLAPQGVNPADLQRLLAGAPG